MSAKCSSKQNHLLFEEDFGANFRKVQGRNKKISRAFKAPCPHEHEAAAACVLRTEENTKPLPVPDT
ncbi:hypothetical protein SLA2020_250040 [Shorea laevis]